MPPIPPARQRVVEVIADLGIGQSPRWRYGSGLLIGGRQLLTAAHVVDDAVEVTIRRPDKSSLSAVLENALIGEPDARGLDMALLDVPEADELPPVRLALVDRTVSIGARIEGCAAVGYPQWTEIRRDADGPAIRETAQVFGHIPPLSGLVEGLLSLEVTSTPHPLPGAGTALAESEWSGMSGAAVFAPDPSGNGGEVLVGVVAEHSPRRGKQNITVLPLDRLTNRATGPRNAEEWWRRLDVADPMHLPKITGRNVRIEYPPAVRERQPALDLTLPPTPAEDNAYRFAFIARKTRFVDREALLAELEEFAGGPESFSWWSVGGEAGVGKSRLALEAMLRLDLTWRAGFLPRDKDQGFRWDEWRPLYPTFITVDYASLRIPEVQAMVRAINMAVKAGSLDWPVRVLLLDRAPDVTQLSGWGQAVMAAHLQPNRFKEPLILEGLGEEDALALASEVAGPGNAQAALELLRHGDVESRPLFVSFAADALRTGTKQGLKSALDLTRAFWRRTIETFWTRARDAELDALCLATLTGGMSIRTLSDPAWSGLGVPQANTGLRENLSWMYALDNSRSQEGPRIRPLQPSFAGEVFVLDRLQGAVELGHDPSKGLLRAAWRHSPHEVSGFVQRAFSDLPDHPVMEFLFEAGPEPGDVNANKVWSSCLSACVSSRLAVSDQELALKAFKQLLKLAEEIRTDEILSDAAFTAAALISHLGQEHHELAVRTLRDLELAFQKLYRGPAQVAAMPPLHSIDCRS